MFVSVAIIILRVCRNRSSTKKTINGKKSNLTGNSLKCMKRLTKMFIFLLILDFQFYDNQKLMSG